MAIVYIANSFKINPNDYLERINDEARLNKIKKTKDLLRNKEYVGNYLLLIETMRTTTFFSNKEYMIGYNENGKPYFTNDDHKFSLSHSNGICCCVIGNDDIGVDIQKMDDYKEALVKNVLSIEEISIYNTLNSKEKKDYFYQIFTSKEAIVKKRGDKLPLKPNIMTVDEDVVTKKIVFNNEEYMIALTTNDSFKVIERFF